MEQDVGERLAEALAGERELTVMEKRALIEILGAVDSFMESLSLDEQGQMYLDPVWLMRLIDSVQPRWRERQDSNVVAFVSKSREVVPIGHQEDLEDADRPMSLDEMLARIDLMESRGRFVTLTPTGSALLAETSRLLTQEIMENAPDREDAVTTVRDTFAALLEHVPEVYNSGPTWAVLEAIRPAFERRGWEGLNPFTQLT